MEFTELELRIIAIGLECLGIEIQRGANWGIIDIYKIYDLENKIKKELKR